MTAPRWRSYDIIDRHHPQEAAFRDGARRNGGVRERCPLCDGRRLHREPTYGYDPAERAWVDAALWVACHDCKVRWGVA